MTDEPRPGESASRFAVRPYSEADLDAVYEICLKTGDGGEDASPLYEDPRAVGHVYAGPYVTLAPDLAFVLEDDGGVCGYVLGALDTRAFEEALTTEWLPRVREQVPYPQGPREQWSRDEQMYHKVHHPPTDFPRALEPYPSHLHIDLLPRAQGQGMGRRLMETLLAALSRKGSPGVHLGVGSSNLRAIGFYRRMGFSELFREGKGEVQGIYMVKRLP